MPWRRVPYRETAATSAAPRANGRKRSMDGAVPISPMRPPRAGSVTLPAVITTGCADASSRSRYRIAHLRRARLAAEIGCQLLRLRDHPVHCGIDQFRGLCRLRFLMPAPQPLKEHLPGHDEGVRIGDILPRNVRRRAVRRL